MNFVAKSYSQEEINGFVDELFFSDNQLKMANLVAGYLRSGGYYSAISQTKYPKINEIADTYNSFGIEFYKLGQRKEAVKLWEKALSIYDTIFEFSNIRLHNNLAVLYFQLREYKKSKDLCLKAIKINKRKHGVDCDENDEFEDLIQKIKDAESR